MRINVAPILAVTVGAGLAATLAGCSSPASRPAASQDSGSRPGTSSASQRASGTAKTGSATGKTSGTSSSPATGGNAGSGRASALASGMYTDSADGTPHYVFSLTPGGAGKIKGAVNFLYQDGKIAGIGEYSGDLAAGGRLTVALADGKTLTGTYRAGGFELSGCTAVLSMAQNPGGCTFTYHGHVP